MSEMVRGAGAEVEGPLTRAERKERTRQALLDAALRLSAEHTLAAVSLRHITREVGIVPTAFYRHFESVEQLGLELVDASFASLRAMIRAVRAGDPAIDAIVRNSVEVLVEHVHAQRPHFQFIARERFGGLTPVREAIGHQLQLFERELATDLARLPTMDTWSSDDLHVLANLIVHAMVATVEQLLATPDNRRDLEQEIMRTARRQLQMIIVGAANWGAR
ncbi:AcrR family transcriptional regulator [Nocardioides massiliensis]|uniref:AcrR family transcriptional regulator n=2 Tax=Nocardioides massiliensis TaxID=1325935 RepID=A0ABT9NMZ7_9ACTN|nr:AcrR family transcriptional regulator [Nocardioides massiliensis]